METELQWRWKYYRGAPGLEKFVWMFQLQVAGVWQDYSGCHTKQERRALDVQAVNGKLAAEASAFYSKNPHYLKLPATSKKRAVAQPFAR